MDKQQLEQEKHLGNNAFKQAAFADALQVLKHPAYDQPRMHERRVSAATSILTWMTICMCVRIYKFMFACMYVHSNSTTQTLSKYRAITYCAPIGVHVSVSLAAIAR